MILNAEQQVLNNNLVMKPEFPANKRGHVFVKQGNMLSGETVSESWYVCKCGAIFQSRVDLLGPWEQHVYWYSQIQFDCPLAQEATK